MNHAAAAVSEQRQWDRLMAMAKLGAIPGDGVNRACLTELDRQARRLLIGWAKDIGATRIGGRRRQSLAAPRRQRQAAAAVVTGSHMDTQPNGGRFDGIYGVIAGLEALDRVARRRQSRRAARSRWSPGPTRKAAASPQAAWAACRGASFRRIEEFADVADPDGVRFADALAAHLAAEADVPHRPLGGQPHAYVEAHIEQGPRLEAESSISAWSPASRAAAGSL